MSAFTTLRSNASSVIDTAWAVTRGIGNIFQDHARETVKWAKENPRTSTAAGIAFTGTLATGAVFGSGGLCLAAGATIATSFGVGLGSENRSQTKAATMAIALSLVIGFPAFLNVNNKDFTISDNRAAANAQAAQNAERQIAAGANEARACASATIPQEFGWGATSEEFCSTGKIVPNAVVVTFTDLNGKKTNSIVYRPEAPAAAPASRTPQANQ